MVAAETKARSCVVTGAGSGIGRATARLLVERGWQVVGVGRTQASLTALVNELGADRVAACVGDVSEPAVSERAADIAQALGPLSGWVNNAASFERAPLHELTQDSLQRVLASNLAGAMLASGVAIRRFLAAGTTGAIVNVSSIHGSHAFLGWAAYDSAKAGMEGFTRSIAVEYGERRIRCNAVAPGLIAVERYVDWLESEPEDQRARLDREAGSISPTFRPGTPREVATVIGFLLSDDSAYVNGATIPVDGGASVWGHEVL